MNTCLVLISEGWSVFNVVCEKRISINTPAQSIIKKVVRIWILCIMIFGWVISSILSLTSLKQEENKDMNQDSP